MARVKLLINKQMQFPNVQVSVETLFIIIYYHDIEVLKYVGPCISYIIVRYFE